MSAEGSARAPWPGWLAWLAAGAVLPPGARKTTTLWIDTSSSANTPKRWTTGTTWVAVTDKAATDAAVKIQGVSIATSGNKITDAIDGVTTTLGQSASGGPQYLNVALAPKRSLPAFAEHSPETFAIFIDSARRLARDVLLPAFRPMDEAPATLREAGSARYTAQA